VPLPEQLVLPQWIAQALEAPEVPVRRALDIWAQQGPKAPLDSLVLALDDADDDVRTKAMAISNGTGRSRKRRSSKAGEGVRGRQEARRVTHDGAWGSRQSVGAINHITKEGVMRDGWRSRWGWRVSAVVLAGGLLVLGTGNVATQAGERDDDRDQRNPFHQILNKLVKLDTILDALKGEEGNHTLRWDQNLPAVQRFVVLAAFNSEAVLDKNTGLAWEQAPDAKTSCWGVATGYCFNKNVGGTVGWRLPSAVELKSVQDPSLPAPFVPVSVFTGVQSAAGYWSATTNADNPTNA